MARDRSSPAWWLILVFPLVGMVGIVLWLHHLSESSENAVRHPESTPGVVSVTEEEERGFETVTRMELEEGLEGRADTIAEEIIPPSLKRVSRRPIRYVIPGEHSEYFASVIGPDAPPLAWWIRASAKLHDEVPTAELRCAQQDGYICRVDSGGELSEQELERVMRPQDLEPFLQEKRDWTTGTYHLRLVLDGRTVHDRSYTGRLQ